MTNMSYCRFENTSNDFADCLDAIEEAFENDDTEIAEFYRNLSSHEQSALKRLYSQAKRLVELVDEAEGM